MRTLLEHKLCAQIMCYTVYFITLPVEVTTHHDDVGLFSPAHIIIESSCDHTGQLCSCKPSLIQRQRHSAAVHSSKYSTVKHTLSSQNQNFIEGTECAQKSILVVGFAFSPHSGRVKFHGATLALALRFADPAEKSSELQDDDAL